MYRKTKWEEIEIFLKGIEELEPSSLRELYAVFLKAHKRWDFLSFVRVSTKMMKRLGFKVERVGCNQKLYSKKKGARAFKRKVFINENIRVRHG